MRTQREKVLLALGGSVLLHLLVLFAWAVLAEIIPGARAVAVPPPPPEPEPLKVEVVDEEPTPMPAPTPEPKMKPFLDTTELAEGTPPEKARFESGQNTVAASEEAPTDDRPLPGQRGKKMPTFAFNTQLFVPGSEPSAAHATPVPATAPAPPAPAATPRPSPPPAATPEPPPASDKLALLNPASLPTVPVSAPNPYDPSFRPPDGLTAPPLPTPNRAAAASRPAPGTFQPFEEKAALSGSISNRGTASVDSEATPSGRYKSAVINVLKVRWNNFISQRIDLVSYGMVKIHLTVDRDGRVRAPRVTSNTANEAMASVTLDAIQSAPIPPMPADAAALLDGGQLQMNLEFTLE